MPNLKIFKNLKNYKDSFKGSLETRPQNVLGIHLGKNTATVVCFNIEGKNRNLLGSFAISVEQAGEQTVANLASLIAQGCAQRGWQSSDVALALDSVLYMQHGVHSEFTDPKQIAATVRFDTEEALSMDVTDLAIAFQVLSSSQAGAALTVFTARKKQLTDIILALQANNLDPAVCESDVASLTRFIPSVASIPDDSNSLYCLLSPRAAYFIDYAKLQQPVAMRTFLTGQAQNRAELLKREIPVTSGLLGSQGPVNFVHVYDSTSQVDSQQLGKALRIDTELFDIAGAASAPADCSDHVSFAIACGAALSLLQKEPTVNFRSDFMPYLAKKAAFEKAVKTLSICVLVLVIAVGLFMQIKLFRVSKCRSQLREKLQNEYSAVMPGKKLERGVDPVKKLAGELRRVKDAKSGQYGPANQQTPAAKLTLVFEAFNKCASQVHLTVDSISISASVINIAGSTSSRENTLKLFDNLRANNLDILQQRLDSKAGLDIFSISVVPKK